MIREMRTISKRDSGRRAQVWTALALCAAVLAAWVVEQLVRNRPAYAETFAPDWLPLAAAGLAAAGIMRLNGRPQLLRLQRALSWSGLLLMVWAANGLPFDLLRIVGLIPLAVDWPGLATRTLALAAAVVLARLALADPPDPASTREGQVPRHAASWYGYAAFVLALPYPVLRTWWALGGTLGLMWPGAAGQGFAAMAACDPVAAGGRSVPAAGVNVALDAAPAVAGCRLVRHRRRRHDRAGGLLVAGQRVCRRRRSWPRGHGDLGPLSLLRQLVPLGYRRRCRHPLVSVAQCSSANVLAGVRRGAAHRDEGIEGIKRLEVGADQC